jgi:uncharacterized protein (TIGR02611 family)
MSTKPDEETTSPALLDKIRTNPTGRLALRIGIGVLGTLVVALGIVLIPFPGPGWAIVILGLAIWALEFAWARHLLEFTKRHVKRWTDWVKSRPVWVRVLLALATAAFVYGVLVVTLHLMGVPDWVPGWVPLWR